MITATHLRQREHAVQVVEDVEWLLGTDHPDSIAARLGYPSSRRLGDALRRWGRTDLARRLQEEL